GTTATTQYQIIRNHAKYLTPNGSDINKAGIKPDIKVELSDEQRQNLWLKERDKLATLQDPQFARAIEQLKKEIAGTGNIRAERK
ncbi:MAG: hypothetical protein AAFX46_09115, partial [Cyanobacteria bacterium J06636_27]